LVAGGRGLVLSEIYAFHRGRCSALLGSIDEVTRVDVEPSVLVERRQVMVEIIPVKKVLNRLSPQEQHGLFILWIFQIFPLLVDVLLVEVVGLGRDEGGLDLPVEQVLPGVVFQPGMVFDVVGTVQAQAVDRLSLDHLVYEISGLK
jgi:hypothetical protein